MQIKSNSTLVLPSQQVSRKFHQGADGAAPQAPLVRANFDRTPQSPQNSIEVQTKDPLQVQDQVKVDLSEWFQNISIIS